MVPGMDDFIGPISIEAPAFGWYNPGQYTWSYETHADDPFVWVRRVKPSTTFWERLVRKPHGVRG